KGLKTTEKLGGLKWKEVPWDVVCETLEKLFQSVPFFQKPIPQESEKFAWIQEYFTYLIRRHVLSLKKERKPS
ncbi:MAG TPA: hypothetical protein PLX83_18940, partial [bacterium]|nr:hypothetical protein [bacterium]